MRAFWRIPSVNLSVGSVVSHKRKSGDGLVMFPKNVSRLRSQFSSKWQFWSMTQYLTEKGRE